MTSCLINFLTLLPFGLTFLAIQFMSVSMGKYLAPQQFLLSSLFIMSALISSSLSFMLIICSLLIPLKRKHINTFLINTNVTDGQNAKTQKRQSGWCNKMSEKLYSEKEYESILIKTLGDSPKLRIVDFFLDNLLFDFTKNEVIEALGMSKQTFYKYFPELEEYGIVKVSRKIGKAKLYRINVEHPLVKMLRDYETKMSKEMVEKAKMKKPILA